MSTLVVSNQSSLALKFKSVFSASMLLLTAGVLANLQAGAQSFSRASKLLSVDYPNLIARADLTYSNAVERSEDGLPVGNGRMGSLLWTTPSAIHFQINRVDVFGNNNATDSFPERHTDYCGGCAFVDVEFADYGPPVFGSNAVQQLSCYDGLATVEGPGVQLRALAWNEKDLIAVEITDQRPIPGTISINLRMLRPPTVKTLSHLARSALETANGQISLTQAFEEGGYYCGSAVVIQVIGREAQVRRANQGELRLVAEPKSGSFTVLIASAAGFNREEALAATARSQLAAAAAKGFAGLLESNRRWWHEFWSSSFVHLHSADGVADDAESFYTYYLYLMASSSRGKYPTKFNGMLWCTGGDRRQWGGQFWGANQSCLYNNALFAANHTELLDPMFDMYSGMLESCARAAHEQWGSQGIFIPETVGFDGLAPLPDDIASEMRALYLLQKPWEERSKAFLDYAGTKLAYSSRWNWMGPGRWERGRWVWTERGPGPYGPVTHIFARSGKIAYQYWLRYEYTLDEAWLRDRVYPVLKGVAEFYRNYPNVQKGEDGNYHIHHVNSNESVQGAQDTDEEIAAMRGVFPVLIRASRILGTDSEMRPVWQEFLANLAPLPRSDNPQAESASTNREPSWIRGYPPIFRGFGSGRPDGNTMPEWFFDLCTLESDAETLKLGNATLGTTSGRRVGVLSKIPLVAAIMGRADAVQVLVSAQFKGGEAAVLANRMDLREGAQTTSAQRLGNAADALHTALCCDLPAGPGQPSIIRVFAAWPREWDAEYTLLCRGGFLVTSATRQGDIEFVELLSQLGGECRLRNPWGENTVSLCRDGKKPEDQKGSLLRFDTKKGERVVVVRTGSTPGQYQRAVPPARH